MQANNSKSKIFYSNKVIAVSQLNYLTLLNLEELKGKKFYNNDVVKQTIASQINRDLLRNSKHIEIFGVAPPVYTEVDIQDDHLKSQHILEYKKTLINYMEDVPEGQRDHLASMVINLNNQGLYAGLASITMPLLMGDPFVSKEPSSKISLRKTDKNEYLIDTQCYTSIANKDEEILTQLNITYTFDLENKTMQFKVEDTGNLASQDVEFESIYKSICQDLIDKYDEKNIFASKDFNNDHQKAARMLEDLFQDNHFRGIDRTITTLDNNIARKFRGINFEYMHPEIYYALSEQAQHGIDELGRRLENQSIISWVKSCCSTPNRDDIEILGNLLNF